MKKHNAVKVVLITMLVFMLLTWILPAAYFSSEYIEQGRAQMGLFDLFNYPLTSLSYFGYIALFIVLVGGFYGILYKIPAYRTFLDKIVNKFAGKEKILIAIFAIILAVLTSVCGLQFGVALFVPMIVSIILLMGYDKIVAALTVVGSICVGLAGTTYAYANVSSLLQALSLDFDYEIAMRFVILLAGVVLLLFNIFMYMRKSSRSVSGVMKLEKKTVKKEKLEEKDDKEEEDVKVEKEESSKKNSSKSKTNTKSSKSTNGSKKKKSSKNPNKAAVKDEDIIVVKESVTEEDDDLVPTIVDSNHRVWPFIVGFLALLVILVLAFVTWGENGFGITAFEDATKGVLEYELFKFPIFGKILGTVNAFGSWTITDMFFPMAAVILLLAIIYKVKFSDIIDGFAEGAKKAMGAAAIVILVYSILVLVTYHPFQLVIYKVILGFSKGFNIATTALVAILASLFNADPAYVFQSVLPYYVSVVTNSDNYKIIGIMFQSLYGLTMLVAPTSVVLMATLSYLKVNYKDWLKNVWKFLLELLIAFIVIFVILALI